MGLFAARFRLRGQFTFTFFPVPPGYLQSRWSTCCTLERNSRSWGAVDTLCLSLASAGHGVPALLCILGSCTTKDGHFRTSERPLGQIRLISICTSPLVSQQLSTSSVSCTGFEISHHLRVTLCDIKQKKTPFANELVAFSQFI